MQLNSVVGGYKLIELVGEGSMGTVFRGSDILLEREVALKLLRPELTHNPHLVKRFRTEAVALARLNHPHIVTLHQLFRDGDNYFMVLEFVLGETLDRLIKRCGPIPWQSALPLICQALEGLEHAHILKVIHRNIKPANLILTQTGVVKLMNFRVARILENGEAYTPDMLKYMSPEQIQGQDIDYRVDIYAIGMMLYELLTGHVPFDKQTDHELIRAKVEEYPKPPMMFVPNIPTRLDAAVLRALEKSPADRFQSASEFRGELEAILKAASADREVIFPEIRQPLSDTSGIFTTQTMGDNPRAEFGGWCEGSEPEESAAQTVLLSPLGLNGESQQDALATAAHAESFWRRNSRPAFLTLLLPVFLLAFYLLPIDPRSPPLENEAPEIQSAIESPPSAGIFQALVDNRSQELVKVPEKLQRPDNLGPVDIFEQATSTRTEVLPIPAVESEPVAPHPDFSVRAQSEVPLATETPQASIDPVPQALGVALEKSLSPENFGLGENIVGQAAQAMNSEDTAMPDQKLSEKPASRRSPSRRKKLDGGWTIISD